MAVILALMKHSSLKASWPSPHDAYRNKRVIQGRSMEMDLQTRILREGKKREGGICRTRLLQLL